MNQSTFNKILMAPQFSYVRLLAKLAEKTNLLTNHFLKKSYQDFSDIEWAMPEQKQINANGITLSYLHWQNSGSPVILLHGINSVSWSWARVGSLLAKKHNVFAISLRGHGDSTVPDSGYSLDDTTEDIFAFADALGIEHFDLAGESWGGKVAMHFAATHPEKIKHLILADPVMPKGLNPLLTSFPQLMVAALQLERTVFACEDEFLRKAEDVVYLPLDDEIDRISWRNRFRQNSKGEYEPVLPDKKHAEILADAIMKDISELVKNFNPPTLFIQPSISISFWPGETKQMQKLFNTLTVKQIKGDHTFVSDNPLLATELIQQFIDQ